ncbi:hypothetical protein [uncultured Kordia sp.]|uniref:hypothetical protein n=1 Tax=uncultured Kordia sp. TaxID=507699 RepID=UPI00263524D5|nr:hypothetical protein [uncultured Kordia sp.]
MRYITYVFFYAKELLILTSFLTVSYVLCNLFSLPLAPLIITMKIVLPVVFFIMKKMNNQSTLYFLYNLGMSDGVIVGLLLLLSTIDILVLQFILS